MNNTQSEQHSLIAIIEHDNSQILHKTDWLNYFSEFLQSTSNYLGFSFIKEA